MNTIEGVDENVTELQAIETNPDFFSIGAFTFSTQT